MENTFIMLIFTFPIFIAVVGIVLYLMLLLCKALRKYIHSAPVREEKNRVKKVLGEVLKEHRVRCKMTQEFVAESLGVSRQAVSKWETGASDPSMSNLISLAKLYGVSVEELLHEVSTDHT